MFRDWLRLPARRQAYLTCQHKERLDELCQGLLAQRYKERVVTRDLVEWLQFTDYLQKQGLDPPTDFSAPAAQRYLDGRRISASPSVQRAISTAVRIFVEADASGHFRRRRPQTGRAHSALYQRVASPYLEFLREHRGMRPSTLRRRAQDLAAFLDFLESRAVPALEALTAGAIHDYLLGLTHLQPGTRRQCGYSLRSFLRWARGQGMLAVDLSAAVLQPIVYRDRGLIHPLPEAAVDRLLAAVDRTQPLGKRDYALLLLACRYGLRVSEIRCLRLEDIRWREQAIHLRQAKTGRELVLPLLKEIAEALVDYLQRGRPPASVREIFVRHLAPYEALGSQSNLYCVMARARQRAGLDLPLGQRGFHSLRHTLATQLVRQGRPLEVVAEVLGHTSVRSTFLYTKSDFEALRAVALSWRERVDLDLAEAAMATRYQYGGKRLSTPRSRPGSPQEVRP
jgi:site-specific recombinase XerD